LTPELILALSRYHMGLVFSMRPKPARLPSDLPKIVLSPFPARRKCTTNKAKIFNMTHHSETIDVETSVALEQAILLVDDDNDVRYFCRLVLELEGYRVLEADSPTAAQRVWDRNDSNVALLLTDYEMPGLNGLQLSSHLNKLKPNLKTLMISGGLVDESELPQSLQFLRKPFSPSVLLQAVRRCLGF
jgi:CheY-like chemotaxis protein